MKEHAGKILLALVAIVFIISAGLVLSAIFSKDTNIDMFVVWLIFMAEGIKKLLTGGWNSAFCGIGTIMLIAWFVYFMKRLFTSKGSFEIEAGVELSEWDKKSEEIYQQYGKVFWKIGLTLWVISLTMDFIAVGIPTAKQSAVIYIIPKMINNVDLQEIPPNLAKLVNEGLKEMIEMVKGGVDEVAKEAVEVSKDVAKEAVQSAAETAKEKIKGE